MVDALDGRAAYLDEYFGVWAMRRSVFETIKSRESCNMRRFMALREPVAASPGPSGGRGYSITGDGVAVIEIRGTMMKFESSFGGTSTVLVRRALRQAVADEYVKAIVMVMDTPGGTVSGTESLADDVQRARASKPVYVQIEDLCCSAGYWVASQGTRIFANRSAVGLCIGTYMVVDDQSKAYAEDGIVTHVIKAGEFKGAGVEGTEITPEQLAEWQTEVNDLNEFFVRDVAAGRRVSLATARGWADGRVFVAEKMLAQGQIDGIHTLDETLALVGSGKPLPSVRAAAAADQTETQASGAAATLEEIQAACPGAGHSFVIEQLKAEATVEQAQQALIAEQGKRIEYATRRAATIAANAYRDQAASSRRDPGRKSPQTLQTEAAPEHATAKWNELVDALVAAGHSKQVATAKAIQSRPRLYSRYLAEFNAARGRR